MDILVKFEADWADEFTCYGFAIYDENKWQEVKDKVKQYFSNHKYLESYFGTNEAYEWSSYDDVMRNFTEVSISTLEKFTIQALLTPHGIGVYGIFPDLADIIGEIEKYEKD